MTYFNSRFFKVIIVASFSLTNKIFIMNCLVVTGSKGGKILNSETSADVTFE